MAQQNTGKQQDTKFQAGQKQQDQPKQGQQQTQQGAGSARTGQSDTTKKR